MLRRTEIKSMKFVFLVYLVVACAPRISALLEDNLKKSIGNTIELAIEQASIHIEGETLVQSRQFQCSISAKITCKVTSNGKKCEDHIVPMDKCQNEDMTFTFKYCSKESSPIKLIGGNTNPPVDMKNLPKGTMAYINTVSVDINLQDLLPGKCWKVVETRKVDTCKKMINSSLKIEGWRGDGEKGDYCFAWAFYRSLIKRPKPPPCALEAQVSCQRTGTGEECSKVIVPRQECGKEKMTFTFNYCNKENDNAIILREGNTNGEIDMQNLPVGTMAFIHTQPVELNMNTLFPGTCRNIVKTREVNTCWDTIDASLKLEGWRSNGEKGDYCFAWDFYRHYIERPNDNPTNAPSLPSPSCNVGSKVSCIVASTGERCEDLMVPLSECGRETFIFSFEYCNFEESESIDLIYGDNTGDNIDMHNLPKGTMAFVFRRPIELAIEKLPPGVCRTIVAERKFSTCRPTIEASLKVEGWRGAGEVGDYCFAYNFYKTFINRLELAPTRSPTSKCNVSTSITCRVDRTNQSCDKLIVPFEDCGQEDMTFAFEYCNDEVSDDIALRLGDTSGVIDMKNLPTGTTAFIHTNPVRINKLHLSPGECWTITETRSVSTCRPNIDASLKVDGWRGKGAVGDFCFAFEFYRSIIKRDGSPLTPFPSPSPSKPEIPSVPSSTSLPSISSQPTVKFCGLPKEDQRAKISQIIDSVSTKADLENPDSPQSKARDWILNEDTFDPFCPPPCNRDRRDGGVIQRYVLAVFYFATGGDDAWLSCGRNSINVCDPTLTLFIGDPVEIISGKKTWLEPVSECYWGGLSCRKDTQCIDRIEFGKSFNKAFPLHLNLISFLLTFYKMNYLEANSVGGQLPTEIEQLNLLRFLYLEGTRDSQEYFSGNLDLISGQIPPEISTLSNLMILDLNFNLLDGEVRKNRIILIDR
jgi:hypothetical protein